MFRSKSLEKLHTPDNLDQLLVVVRPRAKLTLAALAAVFVIALGWSVLAKVPITVDGFGILLKPLSIKMIQASGGGVVTDLSVQVGEHVKAGQVIVRVEQPDVQRELDQQIAEYRSMREFNAKAIALAKAKRDLEVSLAESNLAEVEDNFAQLKKLQGQIRDQMNDLSDVQGASVKKTLDLLQELRASQERQMKNVADLVDQGLTSDSQRLSMQASFTDTESRISEMEVRVKQTAIDRLQTQQQLLRLNQEVAGLATQAQQLRIQRQKLDQDFDTERHNRQQSLDTLAANIRLTKARLQRQSYIRSRYNGRVLEVAASVGQVIGAATRVAILQIEAQTPFFRIELADDVGKGTFSLLYRGEETRALPYNATPDEVRTALLALPALARRSDAVRVTKMRAGRGYDVLIGGEGGGGEQGDVLQVRDTSLETDDGMPTFASVTELGDLVPNEELKHLGFLSIGNGKRVRPGMEIRVNPANVERQRYGSMIGRVTSVSSFPVTSEGLVNVIGNKEVVEGLLRQGGTILVEAELERNPNGSLKWTSRGPDEAVTAGTTTTCRISVESRRPITFAIPLLRKWFLGEADKPMPGDAPVAPPT
jgi:HlyD family secretion protein